MTFKMTIEQLISELRGMEFLVTDLTYAGSYEDLAGVLQEFNDLPKHVRHGAKLQIVMGDGEPRIEFWGADDELLTYKDAMRIVRTLGPTAISLTPVDDVKDCWDDDSVAREFADRMVLPELSEDDSGGQQ